MFDTAQPGADVIVNRVAPLLRPGAIVLLHDGDSSGRGMSRAQTAEALCEIRDQVEARGLRSVPVSSLVV